MEPTFLKLVQKKIAETSVTPSAMRNMGPEGTIKKAREFLAKLDLKRLHVESQNSFEEMLNELTDSLRKELPRGGRYWGAARKVLNIFLRSVVYNRYLCKGYNFLEDLEPWLEVPLDKDVGEALRENNNGAQLPGWKSVISLTPEQNSQFQRVAMTIAQKKVPPISRVHLDLYYWRNSNNVTKGDGRLSQKNSITV